MGGAAVTPCGAVPCLHAEVASPGRVLAWEHCRREKLEAGRSARGWAHVGWRGGAAHAGGQSGQQTQALTLPLASAGLTLGTGAVLMGGGSSSTERASRTKSACCEV